MIMINQRIKATRKREKEREIMKKIGVRSKSLIETTIIFHDEKKAIEIKIEEEIKIETKIGAVQITEKIGVAINYISDSRYFSCSLNKNKQNPFLFVQALL